MFRRVLWFGVGAGVGVFVLVKARSYLQRATPRAVSAQLAVAGAGIGASVQEFASSVRAAMAERETELRDAIGLSEARGVDLSEARENDLSTGRNHPSSTGSPRRAADL